jgi:Flp pilus assembly protein TadD
VVRARLAKVDAPSATAVEETAMKAGLDALYRRGDAAAAAIEFRKVLALNPTHYGATYQLATALDRTGQRAEAQRLWEAVAGMAQQYKDQKTLDAARARLSRPP